MKKIITTILLLSAFTVGAWADSSLPSIECMDPTGQQGTVVQLSAGWYTATLFKYTGGPSDTFGCQAVPGPVTGAPQEILWCQQTRYDTNYRVRVFSPDTNGTTWVRLTQNGFLGRTVEKGMLKCYNKSNL